MGDGAINRATRFPLLGLKPEERQYLLERPSGSEKQVGSNE